MPSALQQKDGQKYSKWGGKQTGSIVRTSGKVDTTNQKQLKGHFSQIKGIFHQEDITIPNTYSLNSNGHLNILLLSMNRSSRKKSIEKTLELGKSQIINPKDNYRNILPKHYRRYI